MKTNRVFITGSDTGVGKTYVGTALTAWLYSAGKDVIPRKPAESGCRETPEGRVPEDALAYYHSVGGSQPINQICKYRFLAPLAPPSAATLEGKNLSISQLIEACNFKDEDKIYIVEGAGGIYSPIADDGSNADMCRLLNMPALAIIENRLGCINQALLTYRALENEGIPIMALVLNDFGKQRTPDYESNIKFLSTHLPCPIIEFSIANKSKALERISSLIIP